MRKLMLAVLACLVAATITHAQSIPAADVTMGYSVIEVVKGYRATATGGSGSVVLNFNNWLGTVSDFGVYHASLKDGNITAGIYTVGPRLSYRHWSRLVPFTQVLVGGAHASASGGFTGAPNVFAFGAGGGADIGLGSSERVALRPQAEFFVFNRNGNSTGTVRFSVSTVFHIGKKL